MNLLNGILAFGALAFSIPLVIHLFFRSRFKTLDWGAMHLLDNVIRVNRRRMQVTNLLLLLIRCLIPVLLALCLARPVWTGLKALAGDAPKTLIIALDDSRSMSLTATGGSPLIESAKEELRKVLGELSRRDEVMLVRSSRVSAIAPKMGVAEAVNKLRGVKAIGGPVSIGQLLDAAVVASQDASYPRRQILLVSDFQEHTIDVSTLEMAQRLATEVQSGTDSANETIFDFLELTPQWAELNNVSIDAVEVVSPVVVRERSGVYSATIRNSGEVPANDVRLTWSIDGQPLDPRTISIDAKSSVTNRLTQTIDQPGIHQVTAMIDRVDMLIDDNRRSTLVEVMPEINVLIVDGKPSRRSLEGHADYLAIALSPFAFGGDDRPDPIRSTTIPLRRLHEMMSESAPDVVALTNVDRLSDTDQSRLADFVNQGGSLIVFDGPDVVTETYNRDWIGKTATLHFPAQLDSTLEAALDENGQPVDQFSIDNPSRQYEPWTIFSGDGNPFSDVDVYAFRQLTLDPTTESDTFANRRVLMQTTDGKALAVSAQVGEGNVVQFALTANNQWSNLPLRPIFLPLIGQMVLDLAGKQTDATSSVGLPLVIPQSQFEATDQSLDPASYTWIVKSPSGEREISPPSNGQPVRFTETYQEGLYSVGRREKQSSTQGDPHTTSVLRLVTVDSIESNLIGAGSQQVARLRETLGAASFDNADALQAADRSRSFGREIWRWLWAVLLVALVGELWLQQNLLAKRRTAGGLR
ncbi:BatA domain-containing protein [Stieleria sp. JC731]|uniref:BatA domain-containing protein n=1 Tax=Pirellulaceae TaxID=2691357 RepID=UPI001E637298|nr:BatA domain-containing protein [Stieleria sp. JC731]MCC9603298.1 BatA domain-containing protein [Stieleria sp. JC731]